MTFSWTCNVFIKSIIHSLTCNIIMIVYVFAFSAVRKIYEYIVTHESNHQGHIENDRSMSNILISLVLILLLVLTAGCTIFMVCGASDGCDRSTGCLLLGTWSYLWSLQGSMSALLQSILYRNHEVDHCSVSLRFHNLTRHTFGKHFSA